MNNQNMNNITACTNESHEIAINITRKAFVGLARQGMLFHQGTESFMRNPAAVACTYTFFASLLARSLTPKEPNRAPPTKHASLEYIPILVLPFYHFRL